MSDFSIADGFSRPSESIEGITPAQRKTHWSTVCWLAFLLWYEADSSSYRSARAPVFRGLWRAYYPEVCL